MSGHPRYPRGGYHYHMWVGRLVRPVSVLLLLLGNKLRKAGWWHGKAQ
jgi:hypothetical protein